MWDMNVLILFCLWREMAKGCVFVNHKRRESFIKLFGVLCTYIL